MAQNQFDAAVVGSGPNGLAAAVVLADAGLAVVVYEAQPTIGGGLRSMEVFEEGTVHDHCASVLALAQLSPFFQEFTFDDLGVSLIQPDIPAVHLDRSGRGLALHRDDAMTTEALGADGDPWNRMLGRFNRFWNQLSPDFSLRSVARAAPRLIPPPLPLVSSDRFVQRFAQPETRTLFAGLAGHSVLPLTRPEAAATGVLFAASAQKTGWPVVAGGSQALADAMAKFVSDRGGVFRSRTPIGSLEEVETSGPILFDTSAEIMASIAGPAFSNRYASRLRSVKRGPALFKVDYLLEEPIPWRSDLARRATTVHLGDDYEQIAEGEAAAWESRAAEKPFIILTQPTVADPTRSQSARHTAWAYCHVPSGSGDDLSAHFQRRIETHAPGFSDLIINQDATTAQRLESENANFLGGDITLGALQSTGLFARPTLRYPWSTPDRRLWLCSAAAVPGPGIHGAGGFFAAKSSLQRI